MEIDTAGKRATSSFRELSAAFPEIRTPPLFAELADAVAMIVPFCSN
jgi:hypothetical protein